MAFVVGVLGQPIRGVGERHDDLGHLEAVDQVVEHDLQRGVVEVVAAVVDDEQRVAAVARNRAGR